MDRPADRIVGIYRRHAAAFDRQRGRSLMEKAWLDRFTALLPSGSRVLDIGCGGGEPLATHLAQRGFAITGVDTSGPLLEYARSRLPTATFLEADMRTLALGCRFHGLLAWDSFFHLTPDDQRRMFRVFADHAEERAALLFTSGPCAGEAIGTFEGESLYHASLNSEDYRDQLAGAGFQVVAHETEDFACGGHTVWLAKRSDAGSF